MSRLLRIAQWQRPVPGEGTSCSELHGGRGQFLEKGPLALPVVPSLPAFSSITSFLPHGREPPAFECGQSGLFLISVSPSLKGHPLAPPQAWGYALWAAPSTLGEADLQEKPSLGSRPGANWSEGVRALVCGMWSRGKAELCTAPSL